MLIIFVLVANLFLVNTAMGKNDDVDNEIEIENLTEDIEITKNNELGDNSDPRSHRNTPYNSRSARVHLEDRDIETRITESNDRIQVEIDGNTGPIDFDFEVLKTQLDLPTGIQVDWVFNNRIDPIENLVLDGDNITVTNSPNVIIRNNTIKNVHQINSSAHGISLNNCSHSMIYNNTIQNITSEALTGPANAHGIVVYNSWNVSIEENTIENLNATASSSSGSAWGIRIIGGSTLNNTVIRGNTITDIIAKGTSSSMVVMISAIADNINDIDVSDNTLAITHSFGFNNYYGIWLEAGIVTTIQNARIHNNQFDVNPVVVTSYIIYISTIKAYNISITDNRKLGNTPSNRSSFAIHIRANTLMENLYVAGNYFEGISVDCWQSEVAHTYGVAIFSGTSGTVNNVTIISNTINDNSAIATNCPATSYGFYFYRGSYSNISITGNHIVNSTANGIGYEARSYGVYLKATSSDHSNWVIADNIWDDSSVFSSSNAYSIEGNLMTNLRISNNAFTDSSTTSTGGYASAYSFDISGNDVSNISIYNNVFTDSSTTTTGGNVYTNSFDLESGNMNDISIYGNIFSNSSATSTGGNAALNAFYISIINMANISIHSNTFTDSSVTTTVGYVNSYGFEIDAAENITDISIYGNIFSNSSINAGGSVNGFSLYCPYGEVIDNMHLNNNTFTDTSATSSALAQDILVYGIKIDVKNKNMLIIDNYFGNIVAQGGGKVEIYGIYVTGGTNATIQGNTFGNISVSADNDDAYAFGLYMSDCINITSEYNDFEYISSSAPNNNSYTFGFYFTESANITFDSNTLYDIIATNQSYEIYLETSYNVTIGLEKGLGMNITWADPSVSPSNGPHYYVFKEHVFESQGIWDAQTNFTLATKNLPSGIYNYTIVINASAFSMTETIWVTVADTLVPELTNSQTVSYEQGNNNNEISWTFTDLYPDTYSIIHPNGTKVITDQSWDSGVQIKLNVDGLGVGTYIFTIEVTDASGNIATIPLTVIVTDTTAPSISGLEDFTHELGDTGVVEWNTTDYNPDTYILYQNGTAGDPTSWSSGETITLDADDLAAGSYNFTIEFTDDYGNSASHTVIVTVVDTTPPTVTSPADISYQVGTTGNVISWTITDFNNGTFIAYLDDTQISEVTDWISGDQIELTVDELAIGEHNLTIVFTDEYGNMVADTVIITVTAAPTTTPIDTEEPSDDGLGTGAIVAIVIGSLAALAGGGFVIFRRVRR
jgi:hypothetical protein